MLEMILLYPFTCTEAFNTIMSELKKNCILYFGLHFYCKGIQLEQ